MKTDRIRVSGVPKPLSEGDVSEMGDSLKVVKSSQEFNLCWHQYFVGACLNLAIAVSDI